MSQITPLLALMLRLGPGQVIAVFFATALASGFEVLGVGLIFGFAKLVFDPLAVRQFPGGAWMGTMLTAYGNDITFFAVGAAIIALFFVKGIIGFGAVALRTRYAGRLTASFAHDLMALYARQPYEKIIQTHSSEFVKNVLSECSILGGNVLTPLVSIAAEATFLLLILGFLAWIDPAVTLGAILIFAFGYGVLFALINPLTSRAGELRVKYLQERSRAAVEFFHGLREVILSGRERYFLQRFADADWGFISQENRLRALPTAPAFGVQFLAIGGAVTFILIYQSAERTPGDIVATIALFGAAGLRMMPAFNSIVRDSLTIRGHWRSFIHLSAEYRELQRAAHDTGDGADPLPIEQGVALRHVTYRYSGTSTDALRNFTIEIPRGSSIGIVGPSGAGKSTAVEILLGLLRPQSGAIEVDGRALEPKDVARWRRSLGYVPQHIYLADDTVARNIAFGLADELIDRERVEQAARLASIDDFVRDQLPAGYDSKVGERGVGLSGGQIQRIGIARALYEMPQLLIFDEATSALDSMREELINQAVRSLKGKITTVIIAHRLSSIQHCDQIYVLDQGRVQSQGAFSELIMKKDIFQHISQSNSAQLDMKDN